MTLDVAIIDYGISNMFSVQSACDYIGLRTEITNDRDKILNARSAILPGVGAFGPAMGHLNDGGLIPVIHEFIETGRPFMGICLGMQLLMTASEEFGFYQGLDIIPGQVKKFPTKNKQDEKLKVPHIGWNEIKFQMGDQCSWDYFLINGIQNGAYMYFVHSFYVVPVDSRTVVTSTDYNGVTFCSSIAYKNIFATQFHPEKSGKEGLKILRNFFGSVKKDDSKKELGQVS